MGDLVQLGSVADRHPEIIEEARSHGVDVATIFTFLHGTQPRQLIVTINVAQYNLETAHMRFFGIRRWRHAAVSVQGALKQRLDDQHKIGRQRGPGERSPAPLPDWYELAHIAYEHAGELGFDRALPVWQYLPSPDEPYLNISEALHLRQPA